MKIFSAGCKWIVKIFHRGEDSIEDSPHAPPPSESVSPKPTEAGPASIADEETSSHVTALEDKLEQLLPLIDVQQATIQSLEAIASAQKETAEAQNRTINDQRATIQSMGASASVLSRELENLRNTVDEHRRRIQSLEAPPPSQSLMDATMAALSAAQDSTLEFLAHLVAFFAHRREIDVVYSNVDGALAKLEQLLLPTAPFALQGENKYNPEARQQSIGGGAVQTMDALYMAAKAIQPIYNQFLDEIAAGVEGTTVKPAPGLKERERAMEKATDSYAGYQPGPPVSWLFDIVRGSIVCQNADAVVDVAKAVAKAVAEDPRVKVLTKFKNRFRTPTPAGFRDVMLIVRLEMTDPSGLQVSHNCELQIHLEPVLKFSKENNSRHHYEYFRTYFIGSSETVAARLKDLKAVVGNTANLISSPSIQMVEELENDQEVGRDFLERVLRDVMNSGDTERFNTLYGLLSDRFYEYDLAMCILEQQAEVEKARYGVKHKDVAMTYHRMGNVLKNQGKYDEAMAMYQKSLDIRLQVLPPDHTDIADSYMGMGNVLDDLGKFDDALANHKKCLKIQLEALGPKHEALTKSYSNMANVLSQQGKYEEAMENYKKSLKIMLKALGPEHRDVAASHNNMAMVLRRQGKYEEAMENYKESLKIFLKALGPEHTDIATTCYNMGNVLDAQGKYEEAMENYEKCLKIKLKALGSEHEDVAMSYNNMACVLVNQGNYEEAMENHEKSLKIRLKALGRDHTDVGNARYNMALLLEEQGDLAAAAEHLRECVRIFTKAYGEDNQNVVDAMKFLADVCKDMGEYGEAIELRRKRLNIKIKVFGRDHTSVGDTRYDMALLLEKQGDLVAVAEHLHECVRVYTNAYGEDHEKVVDAKRFLAKVEGRSKNG